MGKVHEDTMHTRTDSPQTPNKYVFNHTNSRNAN